MNTRALVGLMLLLTEGVALFFAVERVLHVGIAFAIAALLQMSRRRIALDRDRYAMTLLGLLTGIMLWWLLFPPTLARTPAFLGGAGTVIYMTAVYFAWHQALQLSVLIRFKHRESGGPFPSFPFLGASILVVAGMFAVGETAHQTYAAISGVYVFLTAAYYLARDDSWVFGAYSARVKAISLGIAVMSLGLGLGTAITIRNNSDAVDRWLNTLAMPAAAADAIGFSREGSLDNMTSRRGSSDQSPALYVVADTFPGYMRGLAFVSYRDGRWTLPKADRWLFPSHESAAGPEMRKIFPLLPAGEGVLETEYEVLTSTALLDTVFLPPHTTAIRVATESVVVDGTASVRESNPVRRPGYTAVVQAGSLPSRLSAEEVALYTEVPSSLDPRVRALAAEAMAGAESPAEKADAVTRFFNVNYTYRLGITVPRGKDPLNHFLLEHPPAHCEYFASGATVLLRLSGVPARYVTGFVPSERNSAGGYYLARNKDAHAWVEAWDSERGWFIVDASPEAAIPARRDTGALDGLRDAIAFNWARYRDSLRPESFDSILSTIRTLSLMLVTTATGWFTIAVTAAFIAWRVWRKRHRKSAERPIPEAVIRLQALLSKADAIAAEAGNVRAENETIQRFARRLVADADTPDLDELAEWYRAYERVRYRDPDNAKAFAYLESSLPPAR